MCHRMAMLLREEVCVPDNDADYVDPLDMLAELGSDNQALIAAMRETPRAVLQRNERMLTRFDADLTGWLMEPLCDSLLSE